MNCSIVFIYWKLVLRSAIWLSYLLCMELIEMWLYSSTINNFFFTLASSLLLWIYHFSLPLKINEMVCKHVIFCCFRLLCLPFFTFKYVMSDCLDKIQHKFEWRMLHNWIPFYVIWLNLEFILIQWISIVLLTAFLYAEFSFWSEMNSKY